MSSELLRCPDRHLVSLYEQQSGLWPIRYASTVSSNHPRGFHQPRETNMLYRVESSRPDDSEDHTYQFHVCSPTLGYNTALPRNSQPWSTYSVAEHRVAEPPPSDESLLGTLDSSGIYTSAPSYHIARRLPHQPSGTINCPRATPSTFTTSSSIDATEEAPSCSIRGPQR